MEKHFLKFLKITFFVSLVIYLFDQGSDWINGQAVGSVSTELKLFTNYFLYSFIIGGANMYFVYFLDGRLSWKMQPNKRLITGIIGAIFISFIAVVVTRLLLNTINGHDIAYFLNHEKAIFYFYTLILTLVIVLFFHAFYFYKALTERKVADTEIVAKNESAKYESLKSQLDPHFLFNSLNVLTSLIGENPAQAEKFATKLSKIYRYVLEQKDKDLIPLQEELDFAKIYMELLKMRFENALEFSLPESHFDTEFKIVPLSLQILLENAVKHNVISKEQPLHIRIFIDDDMLCVENASQIKQVLKKSTQVGLNNIKERYALISKRQIKIEKSDKIFRVSIPLLTKKIKTMDTTFLLEENYLAAKKKVQAIKEFYINLLAYIFVIPILFFIWYTYTPDDIQWFWFPTFGWGISMFFQASRAFNFNPLLGKNWEERKLKEFMNNDKKQYWE